MAAWGRAPNMKKLLENGASRPMLGTHPSPNRSGPLRSAGVRKGVELQRKIQVVDVAPTLCLLLGWPTPKNVEGGIVYEALEDPDWYLREQ